MSSTQAPVAVSPSARRRYGQLLAGLVLYAASITLIVHPALGSMPWDVLSQGLGRRLGWSLGTATLVVSGVVLLCWLPLRQRPGFGTVANVLVIGFLVDPFMWLLGLLPELGLGARAVMAVTGIVLNGVATACYIGARLGPGPRDGLMTGLVARTGWSVRLVRTSIEGSVVLGGWLLGGTLGLGTLAYAVAIGPLVHLLLPRFTLGHREAPAQALAVGHPADSTPHDSTPHDDGADRGPGDPDDAAVVEAQTGR